MIDVNGFAIGLLAVHLAVTATHLVANARRFVRLRDATKPLLMVSLLAFYLVAAPLPILPIVLALVFSIAGDTLLLSNKPIWFLLGGIAFLLGHVAYVWAFVAGIRFATLTPLVALIVLPYLAVTLWQYHVICDGLGRMKAPTIAYLTMLALLGSTAFARFVSIGSMPALLTFAGSVVFLVSDFWLTRDRFHAQSKHGDFVVMLTYCAAQLLIVGGYVLA